MALLLCLRQPPRVQGTLKVGPLHLLWTMGTVPPLVWKTAQDDCWDLRLMYMLRPKARHYTV